VYRNFSESLDYSIDSDGHFFGHYSLYRYFAVPPYYAFDGHLFDDLPVDRLHHRNLHRYRYLFPNHTFHGNFNCSFDNPVHLHGHGHFLNDCDYSLDWHFLYPIDWHLPFDFHQNFFGDKTLNRHFNITENYLFT